MIIHFSILFVILFVSLIWGQRVKELKLNCIYNGYDYSLIKSQLLPWVLIFGYICFLATMRSGMNDTSVYINSFINKSGTWMEIQDILSSDGKDKAFDIAANLFKMFISDDYHAWFFLFAIIESLAFVYILRRECIDLTVACYLFFSSTLYYNYFSMMRQWFAAVLLFAGAGLIKRNKTVLYLGLCIILAQFHTSAYLFIPIYFMVKGKAWSRKQNLIITVFVCIIILLNPFLRGVENLLEGTTYDYVIDSMSSGNGSSIIRVFIAAVPVFLAWVNREYIEGEMINICVNMSLLNLLLTILATFTNGLYVIRLSTYTGLYNMLLYPYLLNIVVSNKTIIKIGFYLLYFVFYVYQMQHQGAFGYASDILGVFT